MAQIRGATDAPSLCCRRCGARSDIHRRAVGCSAGLSHASDHAGGAVSRRRRQRRSGARRCREDVPHARQQVVVENRGGAGGTIATRAVAKGTPDGYTILLTYTGTLYINPTLYPNAGYDPRKDFAPIGLIGWQPSVLTVHPSLPARTPSELVAYAKANPGKVNYAFVPGTIGQMTAEMFARSTGIELTRIPYKGNGQAVGDLIGGHVSMMVLSLSTILGNVKTGKLFALAVIGPLQAFA